MKHIIRFGTLADKKDLIALSDTYDMIVVNANAIAHSGNSIANFLLRNICVKGDKQYYIDPITYAFQDHLELLHSKPKKQTDQNGRRVVVDREDMLKQPIKPPFRKLIDEFGPILEGIRVNKPLQADMFLYHLEESQLTDFCRRVLDFQKNTVRNVLKSDEIGRYLEYDGVETDKGMNPAFLIAPYFYMDIDNYDEWLAVNTKLYGMCRSSEAENIEIRMEIFVDRRLLQHSNLLDKIANECLKTGCSSFILWIDGFEETLATETEIDNLLFFLRKFVGKSVYSAYGGFFAILLCHNEIGLLNGVSHGLEYGEDRRGYPVGGGQPTSKYYYPPLHRRLKYLESFDLLERCGYLDTNTYMWGESYAYLKEICRCKICKELMPEYMKGFDKYRSTDMYEVRYAGHIQRRTMATSDEKKRCRYHYMYCKKMEFNYIKKRELRTILQDLVNTEKKYEGLLPAKEKALAWICSLQKEGENGTM